MFYPLLIFSAVLPLPRIDYVDKVEVNHCYTNGRATFDQVIYWDWNLDLGRYDVIDYRMEKEGRRPYQNKEEAERKHIEFYQNQAVQRALTEHKKSLDASGTKYKINEEKFKNWYIEKYKPDIPQLDEMEYVGSDMSVPIGNVLLFHDIKTNTHREIRFKILIETWTDFDPEVKHRDIVPQHKRRFLK